MTTRHTRGRPDLTTPRAGRGFGIHYDPDQFGRFSEGVARFIGTARFLVLQTALVAMWMAVNIAWSLDVGDIRHGSWDPYPFYLLNLVFSTQSAYAAPLILLAQNRQADRDRAEFERDREITARTQADTQYLARELTAARLSLAGAVTLDELRRVTDQLAEALEALARRIETRTPFAVDDTDEASS